MFSLVIPKLAERAIQKPVELDDGTIIKVNSGSARVFIFSATGYNECVWGFSEFLESMGEGLSALDIEIRFNEGDAAREFMEFAKAGSKDPPTSPDARR